MVALDVVRKSNANLKALGPGLVAVFVGGTSGIGESTAREFVRNTIEPRVYLVGRSADAAARIEAEFVALNPGGSVDSILTDASLLANVDAVCARIQAKERKVNLLFNSSGFLSISGRDETSEGLDKKFSLNYYSRMRFIQNLLPQLTAAAASSPANSAHPSPPTLSRSISVLAAGDEGPLLLSDLLLRQNYSLNNCRFHATTMNSLAAAHLATIYPHTTFVHTHPGIVKTGIARGLGRLAWSARLAGVLLSPWAVPLQESGERHLYAATVGALTSVGAVDEDGKDGHQHGMKGRMGMDSGVLLMGADSEPVGKEKVLRPYMEEGVDAVVWKHTIEAFDKISATGCAYEK